MATKIRMSGEIMPLPITELADKSAQVVAEMGPNTEALVTRNKEVLGVFMSVERRNALAEVEDNLQAAMLHIDMLQAGRSYADVERSAEDVKNRRGKSASDVLSRMRKEAQEAKES